MQQKNKPDALAPYARVSGLLVIIL